MYVVRGAWCVVWCVVCCCVLCFVSLLFWMRSFNKVVDVNILGD